MLSSAIHVTTSAVAAHYAAFPYPQVHHLQAEHPPGRAAGALDWLLRRRGRRAFSGRPLRIWVAGCGTRQAAQVALAFPGHEILATDVSAPSLRIARALACQLHLRNIRFERADLRDASARGRFDLIFCTGVLHHLADPAAGLRVVRRALRPDGAAVLMLYSRVHRMGFEHFRQGLSAFSGAQRDPRAAARLLGALLASRCRPVAADVLREVHRRRHRDAPTFADTLLHPRERAWDIDELMAFVRGGGLSFSNWVRPTEWAPERYFTGARMRAALGRLAPLDRWRIVYWLGAHASPLFRFVAERDGPGRAPDWTDAELARLRVAGVAARIVHRVRDGRVTGSGRARVIVRRGATLSVRFEPFQSEPEEIGLPVTLAPLLERAAPGALVPELLQLGGGRRETLGAVRALLDEGFLVPLGPPPAT